MLEYRVDVVGFCLGEEADAPEIDAEHWYFDVASEFCGAQERPVATENEHQFAAFRRSLVGVHHLDLDPEGANVIGRQVQRSSVDGLRGEHA
jgi:hypothetical protein